MLKEEMMENELFRLDISNDVRVFDSKEYSGNNEIIEVFVPDSVIEIGEGVFRDCSKIKKVILSKNAKTIQYKCNNNIIKK